MAMQTTGGEGGLSSDINVTPMIDVLLVLLIIFMIILPLSRKAFDAQVPPEQQPRRSSSSSPHQIVLELTADGGYAINTQPYAKSQLDAALAPDLRPARRQAPVHQGGAQPHVRRRHRGDGHRQGRGGPGDRLHAAAGAGRHAVATVPRHPMHARPVGARTPCPCVAFRGIYFP